MALGFFGVKPQDLEKLLKKLGITVEEVEAVRVVVEVSDGSVMVFENPASAAIVRQKGATPVLYVVGEYRVEEKKSERGEAPVFTEEDVKLVAEQAGVSLEEARRALEETGGDIALAILKLTQRSNVAS
ncbi:MAG: nascent polypeptide-associated complex protein [Acidilobaceae archaeon]